MQADFYPPDSPRFKANLSKASIVAAAGIGDEEGLMEGVAMARKAVELDPTEGDHRQVTSTTSHGLCPKCCGRGERSHTALP